jgi:dTDP-4-amino-4,6-dideoxygalactose transaminase
MAALTAMLRAAEVAGGEVICPSFTFPATPAAVELAGATPVFADVHFRSMTLSPQDVTRKLTAKTIAILGVDPYGICCDYDALAAVKANCMFDSAPAFGSLVGGKQTGLYGRAQIFSFHATKPFSTMEGGCLCSFDPALLDRAKRIRNFGQGRNGDVGIVGFNGKMTEVCALFGLQMLKTFDERRAQRHEVIKKLVLGLTGVLGIILPSAPTQYPVYTYMPIFVDAPLYGMDRNQLMLKLADVGIETRKYYPACHTMSAWYHPSVKLLVTEMLAEGVIALPCLTDMSDDEIDHVCNSIRKLGRGGCASSSAEPVDI